QSSLPRQHPLQPVGRVPRGPIPVEREADSTASPPIPAGPEHAPPPGVLGSPGRRSKIPPGLFGTPGRGLGRPPGRGAPCSTGGDGPEARRVVRRRPASRPVILFAVTLPA